jgi:hypothetical protein
MRYLSLGHFVPTLSKKEADNAKGMQITADFRLYFGKLIYRILRVIMGANIDANRGSQANFVWSRAVLTAFEAREFPVEFCHSGLESS